MTTQRAQAAHTGQAGEPPNRRADWVANRDALVRAAADLFAERGTDVSFEDVAQRAGVGRATLYRHFPTHEALRLGVIEQIVEGLETACAEQPEDPDTLRRAFQAAVKLQLEALSITELLPPAARRGEEIEALRQRVRAAFERPLAAAQAAGAVAPGLDSEDVRLQLVMLAGVIRPGTDRSERLRAWRLAESALGMRPVNRSASGGARKTFS